MIDLPTCNYWGTRFWFIIWGMKKVYHLILLCLLAWNAFQKSTIQVLSQTRMNKKMKHEQRMLKRKRLMRTNTAKISRSTQKYSYRRLLQKEFVNLFVISFRSIRHYDVCDYSIQKKKNLQLLLVFLYLTVLMSYMFGDYISYHLCT